MKKATLLKALDESVRYAFEMAPVDEVERCRHFVAHLAVQVGSNTSLNLGPDMEAKINSVWCHDGLAKLERIPKC